MRYTGGRIIAIILGLLAVFEIVLLSFYMIRLRGFKGGADIVVSSADTKNKFILQAEKATSFIQSIPANRRVKTVRVNFYEKIPQENEVAMAFFLPETMTRGSLGDSGALCSEPKLSKDGKTSEIDFYATPEKLAEKIGREKALRDINNLLLECLGYAAMRQEYDVNTYLTKAKAAFSDINSLPAVLDISL